MQPLGLQPLPYLLGFLSLLLPVAHSAAQTVKDCQGPRVLSATVIEEPTATNKIEIIVDESLTLATAHSPVNASILTNGTFRIVMFGSNVAVGISSSDYAPGTYPLPGVPTKITLRVSTTNWFYRSNYFIIFNNLSDARNFIIAPNTIIPVTWPGLPPGPLPPSASPVLKITKVGSNGIRVSWPTNAYSYALEWTTNVAALGPSDRTDVWCEQQPMANPFIANPAPEPYRIYRLHKRP